MNNWRYNNEFVTSGMYRTAIKSLSWQTDARSFHWITSLLFAELAVIDCNPMIDNSIEFSHLLIWITVSLFLSFEGYYYRRKDDYSLKWLELGWIMPSAVNQSLGFIEFQLNHRNYTNYKFFSIFIFQKW